ncbi:MAG: hypothetical protein QM820_48660 [Minicystis sp.]
MQADIAHARRFESRSGERHAAKLTTKPELGGTSSRTMNRLGLGDFEAWEAWRIAKDLRGRSRRGLHLDDAPVPAHADITPAQSGAEPGRTDGKEPMMDTGSGSSAAAIRHLAAIAPALRKGQTFSITRLTILKSLCRAPRDAALFALHLATAANREIEHGPRPRHIDPGAWRRHRDLVAEAMAAMREHLARPSTQSMLRLRDILSRVEGVQNTFVPVPFGQARNITDTPLLIIEYALRTLVSPHEAMHLGYRIARAFAERYDPEHGTGLIPASAPFVEEIAEFWSRHARERPLGASPAPTPRKSRKAVAQPSPRKAPRPAPSPVATTYPAITRWVNECGWIEIGYSEGSTGFIRALDTGGMIWEGKDTYTSLDAAMAALDKKLAQWMAKHL